MIDEGRLYCRRVNGGTEECYLLIDDDRASGLVPSVMVQGEFPIK